MVDFTIGDEARLSATVSDITGALVDPSLLTLTFRTPSGTVSAATPVRASIGAYYFDLLLNESGTYSYRWASTGTYPSVEEGGVFVAPWSF